MNIEQNETRIDSNRRYKITELEDKKIKLIEFTTDKSLDLELNIKNEQLKLYYLFNENIDPTDSILHKIYETHNVKDIRIEESFVECKTDLTVNSFHITHYEKIDNINKHLHKYVIVVDDIKKETHKTGIVSDITFKSR